MKFLFAYIKHQTIANNSVLQDNVCFNLAERTTDCYLVFNKCEFGRCLHYLTYGVSIYVLRLHVVTLFKTRKNPQLSADVKVSFSGMN